jgi:hypothetical protein
MAEENENVANQAPVAEIKTNRSRSVLFLLLFICTSIPLLKPLSVPNKPIKANIDLFATLMNVPNGSTVIIQSDWTNSTRGESGGEMDAILRILMRKECKLALYSAADPQAPQVARNEIQFLNDERKAKNQRLYEKWKDFVVVGYFPNAEGTNNAMVADLRTAWAGKKDVAPDGTYQNVFNSPVLQKVHQLSDVPLALIVTASNSFNVFIERITGKVPIAAAVTGVMGPESQVYYASGQLSGLAIGLKGVYDLETLMENGVNVQGPDAKVEAPGVPPITGFAGETNYAKGKMYYPTLHVAIALMILAIITGNVMMFRNRKRGQS